MPVLPRLCWGRGRLPVVVHHCYCWLYGRVHPATFRFPPLCWLNKGWLALVRTVPIHPYRYHVTITVTCYEKQETRYMENIHPLLVQFTVEVPLSIIVTNISLQVCVRLHAGLPLSIYIFLFALLSPKCFLSYDECGKNHYLFCVYFTSLVRLI